MPLHSHSIHVFKWFRLQALALIVVIFPFLARADPPPLLTHADDYTFGYYPHGWRGADANGDRLFVIQTNHYTAVINTTTGTLDRIGLTPNMSGHEAVVLDNSLLDQLPRIDMKWGLHVGNRKGHLLTRGANKKDDVVIQRLGKYLQHVEIRNVTFSGANGDPYTDAPARLEFFGWSDRLTIKLHVEGAGQRNDILHMDWRPDGVVPSPVPQRSYALVRQGQTHLLLIDPDPATMFFGVAADSSFVTMGTGWPLEATSDTLALVIVPAKADDVSAAIQTHMTALETCKTNPGVTAQGIAPYSNELPVTFDPVAGWHRVLLGDSPDINTLERVRVQLHNDSTETRTYRLNFAKEGGSFGITGMSPVLREASGFPIGLPVQISKNWHCKPPWFSGLTMIDVAAGDKIDLEFDIAYARWGGVPAVAHAQLSLEGWGTNQQWDQMAIGSFGESICYDPDVNLNRSMIDDMRPLMVWGMGQEDHVKWRWTHNVGGGDFLVVHQNGKRQYLSRQKTLYEDYGPVISDVTYAGETPDGAIQSRIRTQSWRTDDYVRGLYTLRYDVVRPVEQIDRLAFFQLGADRYNHNLFTTISRGDTNGLAETWPPDMGGNTYSRRGEPLTGDNAWIALTGGTKNPPDKVKAGDKGAWANRGFVLRSWQARIGGKEAAPAFSVYGTEDGDVPSAIVELSPPSGTQSLQAGDFVECQVEMLILPQFAEDYYGPNEALRAFLANHPDSWELVHREAVNGNPSVVVQEGTLISTSPITVKAAGEGTSARFTVNGGVGYVPLTITGVSKPGPFRLTVATNDGEVAVDQSTETPHDWWQARFDTATGTYSLSFTLPMDPPQERRILWELAK